MIASIIFSTIIIAVVCYEKHLSNRIQYHERLTQARIEQASHNAWYEGYQYANQQAARRHPRDARGKFTAKS